MPLNETIPNTPDAAHRSTCPRDGCPAPAHDTNGGYARGCRSGKASLARRRYLKLRTRGMQDRRRPAFPTRRRLRALSAAGWSWPLMSEQCGLTWRALSSIASDRSREVMTTTAVVVEKLYAQLSHVPGPRVECRTWGAKRGWIPCDEWLPDELDDPTADPRAVAVDDVLDEYAVEAAVAGHLALRRLGLREQNEAVRLVLARVDGYSTIAGLRVAEACRLLTCTAEEWHPVADRVQARARRAATRAVAARRDDPAAQDEVA